MDTLLESADVPDSVVLVVRAALRGGLLTDVETMAAHLQGAGWVRQVSGGAWSCPSAPAWSVESGDHAPSLSIFAQGQDALVVQAADRLRCLVDGGDLGPVERGEPDPDWTLWTAGALTLSLNATMGRALGKHWVEAILQLAVERSEIPSQGLPHDPQRDLRVARAGSPIARWHLAGQQDLHGDVVQLLAADDDPAVVAALAAGERHRRPTPPQDQRGGGGRS